MELSIVIIIIGFLIAGITAGSSLVKQAQITALISDLQNFQTAYTGFDMRYNAVPGDMVNGPDFWPTGASGCAALDDAECIGNGDGIIDFSTVVPNETASVWRELALAGLINAPVQAVDSTIGWNPAFVIVGTTVPESRISGVGYMMTGPGLIASDDVNLSSPWNDGQTNAVFIGRAKSIGLGLGAFTPEEAFNLDKKIDDATVISSNFTGAATGKFRSTNQSVSGGNACLSGINYDLTVVDKVCVSGFAMN